MAENIQERIFDMFFRGHADSQGTGLGLYTVKTSINKLNGTINVESKEGEGTHFSILLPLEVEEESADIADDKTDTGKKTRYTKAKKSQIAAQGKKD